MPSLSWGGTSFLVSADDLTFLAIPSFLFQIVWILVDTCRAIRYSIWWIGADPFFLTVAAYLRGAIAFVDIVIAVLSAQGNILEERKHIGLLKCMLWPRLLLNLPLYIIDVYLVASWTSWCADTWAGIPPRDEGPSLNVGGWGLAESEVRSWMCYLGGVLIFLRLGAVWPIVCVICALMLPKDASASVALDGVKMALRVAGVRSAMLEGLVKLLYDVWGQGTMDIAAPSDLAFGLVLVAAKQKQGLLGFEAEEESNGDDHFEPKGRANACRRLCPSTERASFLQGVLQKPVHLSQNNAADQDALRQVVHFLPFAAGVYGASIETFCSMVYPHSSIPSPGGVLKGLWRLCRGKVAAGAYPATVEGDWRCRLNENALRRTIADAASREGTPEAELLWATWENRGPATSPPLALLLDIASQKLVVAVRGTMDVKDCIADVCADATFFDPLGMAGPADAREPPFDDNTGFFAHSTMVCCAEDAFERIVDELRDALAPGGPAHGWGVVCTGHSLGAGVACLLALILKGDATIPADDVHCVAFEPPGGLFSKRLSDETIRLGFLVAVCANDWVSRLSVRAVQEVRERLLDTLAQCDRSKLQLALLMLSKLIQYFGCLCCCLWPLMRLLEYFGGGPLNMNEDPAVKKGRKGYAKIRSEMLGQRSVNFYMELWPPGRCLYFKPVAQEWWFCGWYEVDNAWTAEWVRPEDIHEIIISMRSVELHLPNIISWAYRSAAVRFGAIEDDDASDRDGDSSCTGSDIEKPILDN
mmetsp:Transcript_101897/g.287543  ORF Transcript_101897/g.287543 Transcript_101897/m.287543 type:complete len:760 (+) Transcript_101897:59-2338(+)